MALGLDLNCPPEGDDDPLPAPNEAAPLVDEEDQDHVAVGVHEDSVAALNQENVDIGLDTELPADLNAFVAEMEDYGVDADPFDVDLDVDELSDSDDNANDQQNANEARSYKNSTTRERQAMYEALLEKSKNGKLGKTSTHEVAQQFPFSLRTVQRVWKKAKKCRTEGQPVDVSSEKPKMSGKQRIPVDLSKIPTLDWHKRSNIRKVAKEVGVSKTLLHRWFKRGLIRRHSNSLKPYLRENNKKERLRWCLSMLDPTTLQNEPKFIEMNNIIHIDEKWFNATKKNKNFYMLPEEVDPHRTVQNKNSFDKVMFLAAVALPRHDDAGNETFNGKIGVWPFVRKEPAKRSSRNRARGTLVTKSINVVRDTMRSYLIAKVLPAIREKWPREDLNKTIWIQQDNARTHVPVNDELFAEAVRQTGLDIRLINQPPNSPDMNCLDLGFFASLQSLTDETDCRNMDELIDNVVKKFDEYDANLLRRVFLTLQGCLIEVMKVRGGNRYQIPHMNKDRLERLGILPSRLSCDIQLYHDVVESLSAQGPVS